MQKALILAAGEGKRLGHLTKDNPKCLLNIDSSNTVIDLMLEILLLKNIKEVTIITGHASLKLEEHVNKKWKKKFIFSFIFNPKFKEYNNVYSAYLGKNIWDDETVLLNSDIVFHPKILTSSEHSFLVIDDKKQLQDEDMKVKINEEGKIIEINKGLDSKTSYGEYIGIMYLKGFERIKFLESLENNVKKGRLNIYYEDALADVLKEISVFPFSTEGLPWTEIDTEEDYKKAIEISKEIKVKL